MKPGLAIVVVPAGAYNLSRVGWLRHRAGGFWELLGGRTLLRKSWGGKVVGWAWLAKNGLSDNHYLLDDAIDDEVLDINVICSPLVDEEVWALKKNGGFKRPDDWATEAVAS